MRFFDGCSTSFLTGIAEILEIKMFAEQEHFGQLFHMRLGWSELSGESELLAVAV